MKRKIKKKRKGKNKFLYTLCNIINLPLGIVDSVILGFFGIMWCITIIGIPYGMVCFKMVKLAIWPFGKKIVLHPTKNNLSLLFNIIWLLLTGVEIALTYFFTGILLCITIIGIPWGIQRFKMARLVIFPFGAKIT